MVDKEMLEALRMMMQEELKPQALKRIQSRLVLEAVVEAEKIEATQEDIEKEIENPDQEKK